ncbi:hypothetical protein [Kitasatospora xanthocidica]|uniref:hypothetical protein n=1 Tax=Kitasatospora xanthocidica TaxID=83382 RepID=UPI001676F8AD|nr:hypothetical protein [Kitasatospora xanthocidica]
MSLLVDVFTADENGESRFLDVPKGSSDLAGFESWRTTVWGSDTVRSLGARFFPQLAGDDLRVPPEDVPEFIEEALLLQSNIESIAARMDSPKPVAQRVGEIAGRLNNILDAAHRASRIRGGVQIW